MVSQKCLHTSLVCIDADLLIAARGHVTVHAPFLRQFTILSAVRTHVCFVAILTPLRKLCNLSPLILMRVMAGNTTEPGASRVAATLH